MRTRLVRPSFWTDTRMARLSFAGRLVFVGTWMLADDAGYLDWDASEIAVQLFPHDTPGRRAKVIDAALAELTKAGPGNPPRIRILECGAHAVIPSLPDHRATSGVALFTIQKRHERRCSVVLRSPTKDLVSDSVSDSDSVSIDAQARETKKRPGESLRAWADRIAAMDVPRPVGFRAPEDS